MIEKKFGLKMFFFPFTITALSQKLNYLFFHHSYLSAKTSNHTSISVGMGSKHLKVNKVNRKTFLYAQINICMIAFAIDLLLHDWSFLFQNYWNWISFRSHLADKTLLTVMMDSIIQCSTLCKVAFNRFMPTGKSLVFYIWR